MLVVGMLSKVIAGVLVEATVFLVTEAVVLPKVLFTRIQVLIEESSWQWLLCCMQWSS